MIAFDLGSRWSSAGLAALALSFLAPVTFAQPTVSIAYSEPVNLPGFTVVTFTIESERSITAIGADFDGPMNQVNPGGAWTIYNDINPFFECFEEHPSQDSQITLNSIRNGDAWMLTAFARESAEQLSAHFTFQNGATVESPLTLAQIAMPNDAPGLQWEITVLDDQQADYVLDGNVRLD